MFVVSDIHLDYADNRAWLDGWLVEGEHGADALIVAGDVSDDEDGVLLPFLRRARAAFGEVVFVPGNHDLWVKRGTEGSLGKLQRLLECCEELGVRTRPVRLFPGTDGRGGVWVIPLLAWHHPEFDTEPDVLDPAIPPPHQVGADYRRTKWPEEWGVGYAAVAERLDAMNDARGVPAAPWPREDGAAVITVSHFLPFEALLPEKRFLFYPHLAKMAGSAALGARVRALAPDVHVFGHTHFAWDGEAEGIRCVQAPAGYPKERAMAMTGGDGWTPLLLYDGGQLAARRSCKWCDHYALTERDPSNTALAPYVAKLWPPRGSR